MSYFLIPITNLIIKQNLVFKDTIIIPIYQTKQVEECKEIYPEIYSIITTNNHCNKHLIPSHYNNIPLPDGSLYPLLNLTPLQLSNPLKYNRLF